MKKILYSLLLLAFLHPVRAQESGIRFFHGSWEEAIALAQKEKKKIFIDFFTEWCGPCLNMAQTVFTLPQVGEIYNKHFICLKIDAEKEEGRELARRYGVHFYPNYVFVDPATQQLIHRSGGNKPAEDFIADTKGALNPKLSSVYLNEKYNSGKYDLPFLIDYIYYQKYSGNREPAKEFEKLADLGGKLTDPRVWAAYRDCLSGYRNPYVKQISDNYRQFTQLFGKEEVDAKLMEATQYAPIPFIEQLCDFNGKDYNLKMAKMSLLFREGKEKEAWAWVDRLIADTTLDRNRFVRQLSFYTRIDPHSDDELSFEQLLRKVRYNRYVAYNLYDRDDAYTHYNYALALEYLIRRSLRERKAIPTDLLGTPQYGKKTYDIRSPLLKPKPKRK